MKSCWSIGVVLVLGALGCSDSGPQGSAVGEPPAAEVLGSDVSPVSDRVLLEELEVVGPASLPAAGSDASLFAGYQTRDHQLWLHSGTPSLYTVKDEEGKVLAQGIDDARLKRDYPDLHDLVHNAVDVR